MTQAWQSVRSRRSSCVNNLTSLPPFLSSKVSGGSVRLAQCHTVLRPVRLSPQAVCSPLGWTLPLLLCLGLKDPWVSPSCPLHRCPGDQTSRNPGRKGKWDEQSTCLPGGPGEHRRLPGAPPGPGGKLGSKVRRGDPGSSPPLPVARPARSACPSLGHTRPPPTALSRPLGPLTCMGAAPHAHLGIIDSERPAPGHSHVGGGFHLCHVRCA